MTWFHAIAVWVALSWLQLALDYKPKEVEEDQEETNKAAWIISGMIAYLFVGVLLMLWNILTLIRAPFTFIWHRTYAEYKFKKVLNATEEALARKLEIQLRDSYTQFLEEEIAKYRKKEEDAYMERLALEVKNNYNMELNASETELMVFLRDQHLDLAVAEMVAKFWKEIEKEIEATLPEMVKTHQKANLLDFREQLGASRSLVLNSI